MSYQSDSQALQEYVAPYSANSTILINQLLLRLIDLEKKGISPTGGTLVSSGTESVSDINAFQLVAVSDTNLNSLDAEDIQGAVGITLPSGTILASSAGIKGYSLNTGTVVVYMN